MQKSPVQDELPVGEGAAPPGVLRGEQVGVGDVVHDLPVGLGELQREDRCDGLGPRVLQEEADAVVGAANNTRNTDTAVSGRWHTRAVHVMRCMS